MQTSDISVCHFLLTQSLPLIITANIKEPHTVQNTSMKLIKQNVLGGSGNGGCYRRGCMGTLRDHHCCFLLLLLLSVLCHDAGAQEVITKAQAAQLRYYPDIPHHDCRKQSMSSCSHQCIRTGAQMHGLRVT